MRALIACLFSVIALTAVLAVDHGGPSSALEQSPAGTGLLIGDVTTGSGVSTNSAPVVAVDLFDANGDGSRANLVSSLRVPEIGRYEMRVADGCYVVVLSAPHGETFTNGSRWFEAPRCIENGATETFPGAIIDDRNSAGGGDITIGDEVVHRDGTPSAGVVVDLFAADGNGSRAAFLDRTTTDGQGRYRFVTEAGCYVVVFVAPTGDLFLNETRYSERAVCLRGGGRTTEIDAVLDSAGGSTPSTTTTSQPTTSTAPPTPTTTPRPTTSAAPPATTTTSRPVSTSTPAPAPAAFGFSPGGWFADEPDSELYADLDLMVESGATWLRLDFDWSEIERNEGTYHWHRTDRVIDAARDRGLEVLGLITESPRWARPAGASSYSPPIDPADYARFAAAVVERYGPQGVVTFELWNEPNLAMFWGPTPDPEVYADLVKPTVAAMRAVRSDLTILSGGLAPAADEPDGSGISPMTFTRRMIEAGAADVFDGFAIHPFSYPARPIDPATSAWNPFHNLPDFHALIASYGHGNKPIWLTEYGAPTGTSSRAVSEAEQSAQITEALEVAAGWSWTGPILLYAHRDNRTAPGDFQSNFGLIHHDGTPKQAWHDLMARRG